MKMSKIDRVAPIISATNHIVIAPVLVPYEVDDYGTWLDEETIERVAHRFMKMRTIGYMHETTSGDAELVESYILRHPEKHTFHDTGEEVELPAGTWMIGIAVSEDAFRRIEAGEITGVSIGGWEIDRWS